MLGKFALKATVLALLILPATAVAAEDILIADFEGKDYGAWKVTGKAFGPGPARGTLGGQMAVTGFEGKALVNTFFEGDGTVGTLTSPPITIQRRYVNFLIGGGGHPGTYIALVVDGKAVRTAAGPNTKPGGNERLGWHTWDVAELKGKQAVIRIVDEGRRGWGHINVDHILQSDRRRGAIQTRQEIRIDKKYLAFLIPARRGGRNKLTLQVDGKTVRQFAATGGRKPALVSWDVSGLKGKTAVLTVTETSSADGRSVIAKSITQSDAPKGIVMVTDKLYHETYRPQFHFTPKTNWTNDPNGMMFYEGEYHLFFQHNPKGINWGNMTWGHAVSKDLTHWEQLDHAIYPDKLGTIFSGSGVVDHANTAGWQTGEEKVLVCIYTSAGAHATPKVPFTQSVAYSNDRGRTWTKYAKNPVLGHIRGSNRDPKVIWHEPTKRWVMALYLSGNDYVLFASKDLKAWTKLCDVKVPGASECPDIFLLPVDSDPKKATWVFWGGNGNYLLGEFDGTTFKFDSGPHKIKWGRNYYAAQTFSDIPAADGRRIQIGWMAGGKYPGMPFNQQMSFPVELTLRTTPKGTRMYFEPVKEIENLRVKTHKWDNLALEPGKNPIEGISGELFDIRAEIEVGKAEEVGFTIRGETVVYKVKDKSLVSLGAAAPLEPVDGKITLQILVDRTSVETFGNAGRRLIANCFLPDLTDREIGLFATGGAAKVVSLRIHELKSAWPAEK